ncbi:tetratricopeptide repeat protein [Paenibacillus sp. J22TS3]|uniref:tetratricopeptide repeat protein n=1 Tax=Paenibacillus sp. J22TS3 TaxID=2807192 RepID=UPI001B1C909A|nr:tetratricopeptide repeat protein [Paenibacillus sp. J22TS3]GIP20076.1 hypothetical protein J22TS3_03510 [Paenibacillus sp. J22TS3]
MMKAEDCLAEAYKSILENDFEQAIRWFDHALNFSPLDADIHYRCSVTCARSGRLDKALYHAEQAVKLTPGMDEYNLHMERLQGMEMTQRALRILEAPNVEMSGIREAAILLEQAVMKDPLSSQAFTGLAAAYSELGEHPLALSALREAINLLEGDPSVQSLKEWELRIESKINQSSS